MGECGDSMKGREGLHVCRAGKKVQIEIKWRPCARSHKDLEAVLKRKDREKRWGGGRGVPALFWGSGLGRL